jgi:hypothetical protein
MYIEDLIHRLASNGPYLFEKSITVSLTDNNVIQSFSNQLINGNSFTEKQANLAVRLAKKYQKMLSLALNLDVEQFVNSPVFKFPLRTLNSSKTIIVSERRNADIPLISVTFPFDDQIISKIKEYKRFLGIQGSLINWNPEKKSWDFALRENHVDWINRNIANSTFLIDDTFNDIVKQIEDVKNNLENFVPMVDIEYDTFVFKNVHPNIVQPTSNNLLNVLIDARNYGIYTWSDKINDLLDNMSINPNLREILDCNKSTNIQADSSKFHANDLREIISNSLPTLVVIPGGNEEVHLKYCKNFFQDMGILPDDMSVLFRLESSRGKTCNTFIKESKINNPITKNTKVAFISGKIPKPMIESGLYFSSILNFGISGVHYTMSNYIKNHHFVINFNLKESDIANM